jgi:hypothetical protein
MNIKEIKTKFKLHNKIEALKKLGEHLQLFKDQSLIAKTTEKQIFIIGGKRIEF